MWHQKKKSPNEILKDKKELEDLAWQINSCEEASQVFEEMAQCPVCGERAFLDPKTGNFMVLHKNRRLIIN